MSKIPFTLDAWLKDKSQKVETRDGRLVHNIWRVKEPTYTNNRKAEVCALIDGEEDALVFFDGGRYLPTTKDTDSPFDLFIVTPEEELTEFENAFGLAMMEVPDPEEKEEWYPFLKEKASELLALARDQIIKDGYVIEKKAFHDAVEKVAPEVMKEVLENVDKTKEELTEFERELESFYNHHLQVCTYDNQGTVEDSLHDGASKLIAIARKEMCDQIIDDLKKLPGFKEDESHE